jgi:hypothetical protein
MAKVTNKLTDLTACEKNLPCATQKTHGKQFFYRAFLVAVRV